MSTIWLFRTAVAVTAAAICDPIVEGMSNAGAFGAGHFTDRSNLDVVPALWVGVILAAAAAALVVGRLRRRAYDVESVSFPRMLPSIYAMQIFVLFGIETLEQIAVTGHPLGGFIWLGGPIAASLLFHLVGCVTCAWALSHMVHWSARRIVRIVRCAIDTLRKLLERMPPSVTTRAIAPRRFMEPHLRNVQGRAPPSLPLFAY